MNIIGFSGSLRKESANTALLRYAQAHAPEGMNIEIVSLSDMPLYDQDLEESAYPHTAEVFKQKIIAADGILMACPEFNRSLSGVMKNVLDWSSRPSPSPTWKGKPVGIIGASSGPRGTIVAQYDLKRILTYFGATVIGQPEFYVDNTDDKKISSGTVTDEKTQEYLAKYLRALAALIESK